MNVNAICHMNKFWWLKTQIPSMPVVFGSISVKGWVFGHISLVSFSYVPPHPYSGHLLPSFVFQMGLKYLLRLFVGCNATQALAPGPEIRRQPLSTTLPEQAAF